MIHSLIKDTLSPLNVPVSAHIYHGKKDTYITFKEFNQRPIEFADNQEIGTRHLIQIDIWSKGDFTDLATQAKELMKNAGFKRTYEAEFFERDTKIYHKVIRFSYQSTPN